MDSNNTAVLIENIIQAMGSDDVSVRGDIVAFLEYLTKGNISLLRAMTKDTNPHVADAAETALVEIKAHVIESETQS